MHQQERAENQALEPGHVDEMGEESGRVVRKARSYQGHRVPRNSMGAGVNFQRKVNRI